MWRALAIGALVAGGSYLVGCGAAEQAGEPGNAVAEALARGDRRAALGALEDLRSRADTPEERLELARLMVQAGEAPQALWVLEGALARHPDRDDLRLALGRVAMLVQDPSRARDAVAPIGPDSEQHLGALLVRAQSAVELGDAEAALELFREAAERYPDRPEAALARVQALLQEQRHEEARAVIEESLASPELPPDARGPLEVTAAQLEARAGETEAAVDRLERLVEREPDDALAWNALLSVLLPAGRGEEALARAEAAAEAHPDSPVLRGVLADLHAAGGRMEEAEAQLGKLVELSDTPSTRLALARFHARHDAPERAAQVLAEAAGAHPHVAMLRMHLAEARVDAGDLAGAREALAAFRDGQPDDPHVDYLRARLELAEGDAEAAVERLQRLVSRLDAAYTQFWLGRALEAAGDLAGATRRYGLAMRRDPRDPGAPAALLRAAAARGDWSTAASAAQQLVRRAPAMVEAHEALADALLRAEEPEAAESLARRLVEAQPERVEPALLLARAQRARGEHEAAAQTLDAAVERLGPDPALEAERAFGLAVRGRLDEGTARLEALAAEHPDEAAVQRLLASLQFGRGDAAAGARATDRALALAPDEPSPLATRARFFASRGRWAEARADARRYLAARPEDAEMHFLLGAVEAGSGDDEAAMSAYRRAAQLDERHFAARNNLAVLLADRGELDAALDRAQEAYRLDPDHPDGLDTLGWLYLEKGLVDRAVAFLERAHQAAPGSEDARLHLGLAYERAGRASEALPLLESLVADEQASPEVRARAQEALAALEG